MHKLYEKKMSSTVEINKLNRLADSSLGRNIFYRDCWMNKEIFCSVLLKFTWTFMINFWWTIF